MNGKLHLLFSEWDYILTPIYLFFFFFGGLMIASIKYRKSSPILFRHFMLGLSLKLIGCLAFIAVYALYYGGGDTFRYYANTLTLLDLFSENLPLFFESLTHREIDATSPHFSDLYKNWTAYSDVEFMQSEGAFQVIRFAALFGLFGFRSYMAISLFFAFFSFIGIWALYRTFTRLYPNINTALAIPVLYFPSLFFWGSSIMKDSIVIGFLGLMTYSIYKLFFLKKNQLFHLIVIVFSFFVLMNVKQYVVISYIPFLIIWVVLSASQRLPSWARLLVRPVLGVCAFAAIFYLAPLMGKISEKYALESVLKTAEITGQYIYRVSGDQGSAYSLGEISYTPAGLLALFPKAVAVSLFRPFIFEVKNPVMLISAIESTIVLFFTIYVIFRMGLFKFIGAISSEPFLMGALTFSIFFAFAVGISSLNFGALARYKIPCLPFYGVALIVPYMNYRRAKNKRVSRSEIIENNIQLNEG